MQITFELVQCKAWEHGKSQWHQFCWPLEPKIAGSLPTEAVGFFVMEKSTARSTIGREWTIEHKEHETNK
jgi:hypothetical protein